METPGSPISSSPSLAHLSEFSKLVDDYHPSEEAHIVLQETTLALLVGPSSSGRNTVINRLLETGRYHFIISDTTRPPRINNGILEQNGKEYWFRTEDQMLRDLRNGDYLEAEVIFKQQVSGISIRELRKARDEQRIAINDVDIGGIANIIHTKPDTIAIMLLPPSFEVWRERLHSRGKMSPEEVRRRFETACRIYSTAMETKDLQIVVNDSLDQAVARIRAIAEAGTIDTASQEYGRALAEQLLAKTQAFLQGSLRDV